MPNRYPIVGAFYRPPAQVILDNLALDTPLFVWAEPDNPVDPNAIAVYLPHGQLANLPDDIDNAMRGSGHTKQGLIAEGQDVKLGFIPKRQAASLRGHGFPKDTPISGTFVFGGDGGPRILWDDEPYLTPGT